MERAAIYAAARPMECGGRFYAAAAGWRLALWSAAARRRFGCPQLAAGHRRSGVKEKAELLCENYKSSPGNRHKAADDASVIPGLSLRFK
jgi:hypothetical protein